MSRPRMPMATGGRPRPSGSPPTGDDAGRHRSRELLSPTDSIERILSMSSHRSRRLRGPLLAVSAAAAIALAVAAVPSATAQHATSTAPDKTMYDISVQALDGNGAALAE